MANHQILLQKGDESSVTGLDQCDGIATCPILSVSIEQEAAPAPVKRKRGRPRKSLATTPSQNLPPPPPPPRRRKEEDVCFICFDGGDLVLCDRRNCPKAYHPACINREEAFFRTSAKWNCGWHICSTCQKASSYMCYTCTFSVCKPCIKDADYVTVRDNMGLCGTCIKPILLIENITQGDNEAGKVDFDDKLSWEYLFKVYWLSLKEHLSITVDELTKANNPWKEVPNSGFSKACFSDNSASDLAENGSKRRRTSDAKNPSNVLNKLSGNTNWATKELLELVSFMKDGDTSVLPQFDVECLLLDYIKKRNLRDPLQKSQVVCDLMLVKLFGKQRVGHFEMLKLLESHFLIEDEKTTNGETTHAVSSQIEEDIDYDPMVKDRRQKMRKKTDGGVQNENLDAYAAIDVHNINLIYLRRKFLETLLDDINKVHEKVVGTVSRIKVSGSDQKVDIHRLVQVIGTRKATASYQLGTKTTDVMLEILNLDKREVISIDQLSDHNFTEEECKRLSQSIKCGFNKRLTVGDILKAGATLQAMRIDEALEAEILKLNHLRDRASEKGLRKELRECVEKIELLTSTEERKRLLQEVPEVHTDPSMDPSHPSSEDVVLGTSKQDNNMKGQSKSLRKKRDILTNWGNNVQNKSNSRILRSSNVINATKDDCSLSDIQGTGKDDDEECEIWYYRDPTEKTQGPFSMAHLRHWKSCGHFPPYLKIWKTHDKQDESVLLTDALAGRFNKSITNFPSSSLPSLEGKPSQHDSGHTGVDVNCLQKNRTPSKTASLSSTVIARLSNPKEKQVIPLVSCSAKVDEPQVSCGASVSAVPGHGVRETSETNQSNSARANGKTIEDRTNVGSVHHAPNLNQERHFLDIPKPKSSPEDLEAQAAETIQSLSSCVLVKGTSGITWSTTSSGVVTQQNTVVLSAPTLKLIDSEADHATTTHTSDNTNQVSPQTSGWPGIMADPDECDESVSDLLAEVEAMEQKGLPSSPTSTFHCDEGPEKDFFNPMAHVSLTTETCSLDLSQTSILDNVSVQKISIQTETKDNTPIISHCGTSGPKPASVRPDLTLTTTALRRGPETIVKARSDERLPKSGLEPSPRSAPSHDSGHRDTERSQQRRSSGHSRERQWRHNGSFNNTRSNRQWPDRSSRGHGYGSGSYAAHLPKGVKICKFYDSGYCKNGSSCSFWHP